MRRPLRPARAGLAVHPGYISARVTLGRALIEINDLDAAEFELTHVLRRAPENLAAIRGSPIHHRRGHLGEALTFYQAALDLARHDPDLEQTVDEISRTLTSCERESASSVAGSTAALPELERFLDAIHTYRQRRAV